MQGFYAYPSSPHVIKQVIQAAVERLNSSSGLNITTWEENDVAGYPLITPIIGSIDQADFLLADISRLNFNVTFEIGYAIAKSKRVFLTLNSGLKKDGLIDSVGIFDTLGYESYENSEQLTKLIQKIKSIEALPVNFAVDRRAPVYVVETPRRDELTLTLVSRIKKARLKFRSYNPAEDPRLSALDAIKKVAGSFGVAIPLLSSEMYNHDVHNIRAAFVAGLAVGFGIPFIVVQHFGGPIPLDVRDFAKTSRRTEGRGSGICGRDNRTSANVRTRSAG